MIDASLITPSGQRRDLRLPSCSLHILEQLERAGVVIEQATHEERHSVELTFFVKGTSVKLRVATLYD